MKYYRQKILGPVSSRATQSSPKIFIVADHTQFFFLFPDLFSKYSVLSHQYNFKVEKKTVIPITKV
jgi:hypothetical protein